MMGGTVHATLLGTAARLATLLLAGFGASAVALATGGVYTQTRHGDPATGISRLPGDPIGDCAQCHETHASRDGTPTGGPFPYMLFADNDNLLCYTSGCHPAAGTAGVYPGQTIYNGSVHNTSPSMVWPGPTPRSRPGSDSGECVNCHTPHGRGDGSGLIPSQLAVREEASCHTCHDSSGPALADIETDANEASRHPMIDFAGLHDPAESAPGDFGILNRHAECEDCHNPHDVRSDTVTPTPPTASNRNQRVSRVAVTNGAAGTTPTFTFRPPDDATTVLEYEICFKCHSSWTTQPAGQPDTSVQFNPANYSYHPVEAQGKNLNIPAATFVNGWAPTDLMHCSDCHRADGSTNAGPHGSVQPPILSGVATAPVQGNTVTSSEMCFDCHSFDQYTNRSNESRFASHASHQDDGPCLVCHEPHSPKDPDDPNCCIPGDPDCCMPSEQNCATTFPGNPGQCISLIRIVCDPANPAPGCEPGDGIIRLNYGVDGTSGGAGECYATCHGPGTKPLKWGRNALPR
jgi:hypothetical protein